jgi:YesN/AraC family two-component response regulator
MDDKAVEELRNYLKWTIREVEDKLQGKCSEEELHKERNKLIEKISILHENIVEKADKEEIHKALMFLSTKIKEIIFLIAADQTQARDGAIVKTAAKCLSCDKEIEKQIQTLVGVKREDNRKSEVQLVKLMTHRVRQRHKKELSKTVTAGNLTCGELGNDLK